LTREEGSRHTKRAAGLHRSAEALRRDHKWHIMRLEVCNQRWELRIDRIDCSSIESIRKVHMPHQVSGDADAFQPRNPLIRLRNDGHKQVAVRPDNFCQVFQKYQINIVGSGACILRSCCVVSSEPPRVPDNYRINRDGPPIVSYLSAQNRMDYYPDGILDCVKLPIQLCAYVATATIDTGRLKSIFPEVTD
jgi:hypothetical protein